MKKLLIIAVIMTPIGIMYLINRRKKKIDARQRAAAEACCPYLYECGGTWHGVYYSP